MLEPQQVVAFVFVELFLSCLCPSLLSLFGLGLCGKTDWGGLHM